MTVLYPDLSDYDAQRRVPVLAGTPLIVARATLSTTYFDRSYPLWQQEASRVGAMFGAYHWMNHGNIAKQAAWFASAAGPVPLMIDVEDVPGETGYNGPVTVHDVIDMIVALRALGSNPRAFYLPRWYWSGHMGSPDLRPIADLGMSLVASDYRFPYSDTIPGWASYGGVSPTFLQWTNRYVYSGGTAYSSYNAFRGTLEDLQLLLGGIGGAVASQAYADWIRAGRPVSGVARPLAMLRDRLRRYGYTVYDLGNDAHLKAVPPEDHDPFSATGWPVATPRWWITAIDIMPPPPDSGLPSLSQLGAQLYKDRQAGLAEAAFLKYMNWEPSGPSGPCYHDRWAPGYARTSSTDRGHIHISSRSDVINSSASDGYDPVARIRGGQTTAGGDMTAWGKCTKAFGDAVLVGNGIERRAVRNWSNSPALAKVHGLPASPPDYPSADALFEVVGWVDADAPTEIELTEDQLKKVVDLLISKPTNPLSPADHDNIKQDLKSALAEVSFNVTSVQPV